MVNTKFKFLAHYHNELKLISIVRVMQWHKTPEKCGRHLCSTFGVGSAFSFAVQLFEPFNLTLLSSAGGNCSVM